MPSYRFSFCFLLCIIFLSSLFAGQKTLAAAEEVFGPDNVALNLRHLVFEDRAFGHPPTIMFAAEINPGHWVDNEGATIWANMGPPPPPLHMNHFDLDHNTPPFAPMLQQHFQGG